MKKKLTKTIFTIVFVVFLGLVKVGNVSASGDLSCYYYKDDTVAITVSIPSGMGNATASKIEDYEYNTDSARSSIEILNWTRSESQSYSVNGKKYKDAGTSFKNKNSETVVYNGYDDVWMNEQCPAYLIIVNENVGLEDTFLDLEVRKTFLMFSDTSNVSKVKKYLKDAIEANILTYVERAEAIPLKATSGAKEDTNSETLTVSKHKCVCNDTSLSTPIHASFVIGENNSLEAPKVKLLYDGKDSSNYSIQNWKTKTSSSSYTALNDISENNACPDYLIYARRDALIDVYRDKVYLSDSANLATIRSDVAKKWNISTDDVYAIACTENTNSSTNTNVTQPFEKPEYDNPSVNTNIVKPLEHNSDVVSCGSGYMTDIPKGIVKITRIIYIILQILVPIVLVLLGSLDLVKAVMAQKEDEIKKGQQIFIKRLITAIIIFFVFAIIKLLVGIISNDDAKIIDCMNCFLNGVDNCEQVEL